MSASWEIRQGDVLDRLREMPDESVQCCITSPPYYGLRDYGVEGQIGLEETPEAFVAKLVEVFAEVRRVLRDDGTLWLNLGDSYNADGRKGRAHMGQGKNSGYSAWINKTMPGTKPKDLLGVPWLVALALRQPYYAGRIRDERDRLWLAAMLDTEGNIAVNLHRAGQGERVRDGFGVSVKVHNASRALVERCALVAGAGSVRCHDTRSGRPIYVWAVYSDEARRVLREVYPHLVAKQHEARLAFGRQNRDGYDALRLLHGGSYTTLDAPAPPSCLEPGWYLRRDIIWSKPNPMPESVTDRPTSAHEYIFLLSKSATYFYDAEAIREADTGRSSGNGFVRDHRLACGRGKEEQWHPGAGRNKRSVWEIATQPYPQAHFATFPERLVEPMVLAGTSPKACGECGAPWKRQTEVEYENPGNRTTNGPRLVDRRHETAGFAQRLEKRVSTLGWAPTCEHDDDSGHCLVLDPFAGSGTTLKIAVERGRDAIGIELNPEYVELAERRLAGVTAPLFGDVAA